jgi:hypothetical protein
MVFALAIGAVGLLLLSNSTSTKRLQTTGASTPRAHVSSTSPTSQAALLISLVAVAVPLLGAFGLTAGLVRGARARWTWPVQPSETVVLEPGAPYGELPRRYITWLRGQTSYDLLIVIEDLDRCDAPYVAEVLTSMHLMSRADSKLDDESGPTAKPHAMCVAVLADGHWLEQIIEQQAGPLAASSGLVGKRYGSAYLEKMFIASAHLPAIPPEQRALIVRGASDSANASVAADNVHGGFSDTPHAPLSQSQVAYVGPTMLVPVVAGATTGRLRPPPQRVKPQNVRLNREVMHGAIVERMADLAALAEAETQLVEDYAHLMEATPRGVKRTLVGFWINRAIAQSVPHEPPFTDEEVMRWTILTLRWPTLIEELVTTTDVRRNELAQRILGREFTDYSAITTSLDLDRAVALFRA